MVLESSLVKTALTQLKKIPQCHAEKIPGGKYKKGQPDVFICYKGYMILAEFKIPGKVPTDLQKSKLRKWAKSGAICLVVNNYLPILKAMREIDKKIGAGSSQLPTPCS
jgi:hypothetical protein